MKKMRNGFLILLAALFVSLIGAFSLSASADYEPKPSRIKAIQRQKTVYVGGEFDVKVRTYPYDSNEDYLKWTIVKGKNIVRFTDSDRSDDSVELRAVRTGTAKLRCQIRGTNKSVYITIWAKKLPASKQKIYRVGSSKRTVWEGSDFDLDVRTSRWVNERNLKWTIQNPSILGFQESRRGDEVELLALSAGTTTVTCRNTKTNKSITYTVTVEKRPNYGYGYYDWDD